MKSYVVEPRTSSSNFAIADDVYSFSLLSFGDTCKFSHSAEGLEHPSTKPGPGPVSSEGGDQSSKRDAELGERL